MCMSIFRSMNIPEDVLHNCTLIRMMENHRIVIENFRKILFFESEYMLIKTKHGTIELSGRNLTIEEYSEDEIIIDGILKTVSFGS